MTKQRNFRLDYGNGQVSERMTRREAVDAYRRQRQYDTRHGFSSGSLCVARYLGEGEWRRVNVQVDL